MDASEQDARGSAFPRSCSDIMPDIFTVGVWGWDFADSPDVYPFIATTQNRLLARRLSSPLLVATCREGCSWVPVSRWCRERRIGHYETDWKALAVAKDARVVFWYGGCSRCLHLVALGKQAGVPTRLVRMAQGEVSHPWPVWLDGE